MTAPVVLKTFPGPVSGPQAVDPNVVRGNDNTLLEQVNRLTGYAEIIVTDTAARDALYPSPRTDQRVFNEQTGNVERFDGSNWIVDLAGAPPLIVASATPAATVYGDSYSANQGASSAAHGFVNVMAATLGATVTSLASGGTGVLYAVNKLIVTEAIPRNLGYVSFMAGLNDLRRGGDGFKTINKIENCVRAALAILFANTAIAANDASVTLSGAWAGFAIQGMSQHLGGVAQQGALGATASGTFTGDSLIVGYMTSDNVTFTFGPATVSVDGVVLATIDPGNGTDGISDGTFTNTVGYGALVLRSLGSGAHTFTITPTTATVFTLDWIGTLSAPQACSPVVMGTVARMTALGYAAAPNNANDAIVEEGTRTIIGVVTEFAAFPVRLAYTNTFYNLTTGVSSDHIHPNDSGHAEIAAAFLRVIAGGGGGVLQFTNEKGQPTTKNATDAITTYPYGMSVLRAQSANGFPQDGNVVTCREDAVGTTGIQFLYRYNADLTPWVRTSNTVSGWGSWGALGVDNVKATTALLASAASSTYPPGSSYRRALPANGFPLDGFVLTHVVDSSVSVTVALQVNHMYNVDQPPQMRTWTNLSGGSWSVWRAMGGSAIVATNRRIAAGTGSVTATTIQPGIQYTYITDNTAAAAYTVTLPVPTDGMLLTLVFANATGAITYTVTNPATATIGLTTPAAANVPIKMVYHTATTTWYPA
jgi:lysophospholipase L1-like esterase